MRRALLAAAVCACNGPPPPSPPPLPPPRDAAAVAPEPEPVVEPPSFELPPPKDPIAALAAGEWFGCVVRASGHVDCWDDSGRVTRVPDIADAIAVAGYRESRCVARRSEITCFDLSDKPKPPMHVAIAGATALFVGATSCALSSGAISCWSAGDGVPKLVREVRDALAIVADSSGDACATVRGGRVWCSDLAAKTPARWRLIKGLTDVHVLGLNDGEEGAIACAVRTGGEVTCKWIDMNAGAVIDDYYPGAMARLRGATAIVADDGGSGIDVLVAGHVMTLTFEGRIVPVPVLADADQLSVHCARRAQGSVVCWGDGANGQKNTGHANAPVPVVGVRDVVAIATSQDRSAAVTRDGRGFMWGGSVGHAVELAGSHDLVSTVIENRGNAAPCFLHRSGGVTCLTWGEGKPVLMEVDHVGSLSADGNYIALLADGTARAMHEPIDGTTEDFPSIPGAVQLVGTRRFECARDGAGRVSCARAPNPATPIAIGAATALAMMHDTAWNGLACAIADGAVSCWHAGEETAPHAIALGGRAVELHAVGEHVCAKLADASLACWGGDAAAPRIVLPAGSIDGPFTGSEDGCTIRKDGRVACWGSNSEGRLGDGSSPYLDSPAGVPGLQ